MAGRINTARHTSLTANMNVTGDPQVSRKPGLATDGAALAQHGTAGEADLTGNRGPGTDVHAMGNVH
jgi:hypothetical protein